MNRDLRLIEGQHPLIHNITNYVAMNFVANSLLAIGASPIMARAQEEVEEISSKSNALALNLGILENATAYSMLQAGDAASKSRIPIVLDVVGVGATRFRMDTASKIILQCQPTVIKGNASEILSLYSHQIGMQGVDSLLETSGVEGPLGCRGAIGHLPADGHHRPDGGHRSRTGTRLPALHAARDGNYRHLGHPQRNRPR